MQIIFLKDNGERYKMKEYEINISKYINERYPDYWLWNTIRANSEEEAVKKLNKRHNKDGKKINYILSITEND